MANSGQGGKVAAMFYFIYFFLLQCFNTDTLIQTQELMLLNCGVGEDSWESLGLQGDPTSTF